MTARRGRRSSALALCLTLATTGLAAVPGPARLREPVPTLSEAGLRVGPAGTLLPFGTFRAAALHQLAKAFGPPLKQQVVPDCGQGEPMGEATYAHGLTVTFLRGRLSGWTIDIPSRLRTDRDIALGSTRVAAARAYPGLKVDDGSLGIIFVTDEGLGGFLTADRAQGRVTGLYAGQTCMVG